MQKYLQKFTKIRQHVFYCAAVEWFYSCKMAFRSVLGSLVGVRW